MLVNRRRRRAECVRGVGDAIGDEKKKKKKKKRRRRRRRRQRLLSLDRFNNPTADNFTSPMCPRRGLVFARVCIFFYVLLLRTAFKAATKLRPATAFAVWRAVGKRPSPRYNNTINDRRTVIPKSSGGPEDRQRWSPQLMAVPGKFAKLVLGSTRPWKRLSTTFLRTLKFCFLFVEILN